MLTLSIYRSSARTRLGGARLPTTTDPGPSSGTSRWHCKPRLLTRTPNAIFSDPATRAHACQQFHQASVVVAHLILLICCRQCTEGTPKELEIVLFAGSKLRNGDEVGCANHFSALACNLVVDKTLYRSMVAFIDLRPLTEAKVADF